MNSLADVERAYVGSRHYQVEALIVLAMAVCGESLLVALWPGKKAA